MRGCPFLVKDTMCLEWRKLSERDEDYEMVFGVCIFTALILLIVIAAMVPERFIPPCLFKHLAHTPCPTCGTYRALLLLKSGHIGSAFRTQPLMVSAGLMSVIYSAYSWIVVIGRYPRLRIKGFSLCRIVLLFLALVLANWLYILGRLH